jgi:tRNA U34 5-methylaminomethyl-2-thiouridine-forming methyltransferase MnmC
LIPIRPTFDTSLRQYAIQVTDDGSRTLVHRETGDCFHSGCGAVAETRHVYVKNSGVADRLAAGQATSVLEIGLGTGLGLLLTLDAAINSGASIRYVACESHWMPADVLKELQLERWLRHGWLVEQFLHFRESIPRTAPDGVYHWSVAHANPDRVSVDIHVGDLRRRHSLAGCVEDRPHEAACDAVYFDPFAPDSNPELWRQEFLARIHPLLRSGGRLVTYCVNRTVRDTMERVGFRVERTRGPAGGKREVMIATKP